MIRSPWVGIGNFGGPLEAVLPLFKEEPILPGEFRGSLSSLEQEVRVGKKYNYGENVSRYLNPGDD